MQDKIRPGYKPTKVGQIPEDWDFFRLGEMSDFITSGSRGWAKYYSNAGPLFIRSQNIRNGQLDLTDRRCVSPPEDSEGNRTRLNVSDLLITITGNSVGNVAWVAGELGEAYISQHVGLVRLLEPSSANYVCIFLSPGAPGNQQIWASQAGQSKPGLNLKNLEDLWVAIPSTSERRAIVIALSDADALIAALEAMIVKKQDLKQAAMQQLLTGKTRLPGFSKEWGMKRLGDYVRFLRNGTLSRAQLSANAPVKYLHYGDIHGATDLSLCPSSAEMPMVEPKAVATLDRLEDGDLIFVDASEDLNGVGKSIEITGCKGVEVVSGLHTIAARFDKCTLADGFKAYLQFMPPFREHLRSMAAGTKVLATNRKHVASAVMALPSPAEQTAIAAVLTDMNADIVALEIRAAKARAIKQGMMQELLTGKVRLI